MKFFDFIEKKKGIVYVIAVVLTVLTIAFAFCMNRLNDNKNTLLSSYTVGDITEMNSSVTVLGGQTLTQQYSLETLPYKQLGVIISEISETDTLNITVEYSGQKKDFSVSKNDITAGVYTYIDLPDEIIIEAPSQLKVSLSTTAGQFTVVTNTTTVIENSLCQIDGTPQECNVFVDLRTMKQTASSGWFWVFVIASVLLLVEIFLKIKFRNATIEGLTAFVMAFFCVVCIFLFQPFSVPDEFAHYRSVYHVSNQLMLDFKDEQYALRMRADDMAFCAENQNSLYARDYISEKGYDSVLCKNSEVTTTHFGYMENKTVVYLLPATGFSIARIIGLGPYWAMQLARVFNFAQCIVMIYFAIKIIPFGKSALAVISLLPINLHIMSSVSYDAFTYGGTVLIFAYILKLVYDKTPIGWKQLLILAAMIVIVIPQKVVYIAVAALVLIIPKDRFAKPKWHFAIKCALGVLAVASILILQVQNVDKLNSTEVTYDDATAGFSIGFVLTHIPHIAKMLFNTILGLGDFYLKSMVSYFGWFEFETPWFMVVPFVVIIALSFMRSEDEPQPLRLPERAYSLLLFGMSVLLIEFLLLVDWTTLDSNVILGVQGRYFLPALPLLIVAAKNNTITTKNNLGGRLIFATSTMNIFVFMYCIYSIIMK